MTVSLQKRIMIVIVDNGKEAPDLAKRERPDLALMDIVLQGEMDGIDTASQLRKDHHLPVIDMTAYADGATIQRAKHTADSRQPGDNCAERH